MTSPYPKQFISPAPVLSTTDIYNLNQNYQRSGFKNLIDNSKTMQAIQGFQLSQQLIQNTNLDQQKPKSNFRLTPQKNFVSPNKSMLQQLQQQIAPQGLSITPGKALQQQQLGQYTVDDYNIANNLQSGAQITEFEMLLEQERKKFKEAKQKLETDYQQEKKMRVEYENKLVQLKNEQAQRDLQMTEMDYKLSSQTQEYQAIFIENQQLKDEIGRISETYQQKVMQQEEKIVQLLAEFESQKEKFTHEVERIRLENEQVLADTNKQWEYKYRGLEEKSKNLQQLKNDLEGQIGQLNQGIIQVKAQYEQDIRDQCSAIQEEEFRKYSILQKQYEQKLKVIEDQRDNMQRKGQALMKDFQERNNQFAEQQILMENELNKQKQIILDLQNQIAQVNLQRDKMRTEIQAKESHLQQLENQIVEYQKQMQRQGETHQVQLQELSSNYQREKILAEQQREQYERKIPELERVIRQQEQDQMKLRQDYDRLTGLLQNNIQRTIHQTVTENQYYKPVDLQTGVKPDFGFKYQ